MEKGRAKAKGLKSKARIRERERVKRTEGKGFYKGKGPTQKGFIKHH